jgi:hypothetical protein
MAAERQFIGDILADENSDYGQESPREKKVKIKSSKSLSEEVKSEISEGNVNKGDESSEKNKYEKN